MTAPTVPRASLLWDMAHDLMEVAAAVLGEGGLPVPARKIVDVGPALPPLRADGKCVGDQLNVTIDQPKPGQSPRPNNPAQKAAGQVAVLWEVTFNVALWRCHAPAKDAIAKPDVIDGTAREHLSDGWQLALGLADRFREGQSDPLASLFPTSISPVDLGVLSITFQQMQNVRPQGGVRGWVIPIACSPPHRYDRTAR